MSKKIPFKPRECPANQDSLLDDEVREAVEAFCLINPTARGHEREISQVFHELFPKSKAAEERVRAANKGKLKCELCGSEKHELALTPCCERLMCSGEGSNKPRRNCCHRHMKYTLCSSHHAEGHKGDWKTCEKCRASFPTELYVWYGTNRHNVEKLPNPPSFEPTKCADCGAVIRLGRDGHSEFRGEHWCAGCSDKRMAAARE